MNRRHFLTAIAGAAGAVAIGRKFAFDRGESDLELVHHASWIMGQIANIWVQTDDVDRAREAVSEAFHAMRRVESALSRFDSASELTTFLGGRPGDRFRASPLFERALDLARGEWRRTEGAFDPCVVPGRGSNGPGAFVRGGGGFVLPSREASLDFGGIGCGIALDLAGRELEHRGVNRALLELSGDFLALEAPLGWNGWPMAAADPWTGAPTEGEFDLVRSALATSATVERSAILDPRDGSLAGRLAQASVMAPTAAQADAWSTALVVRSVNGLSISKAEFDRSGRLSIT